MIDAVVVATSKEHSPYAATTLASLACNITKDLRAYVVHYDLTQDHKRLFQRAWRGRDLDFVDVSDIVAMCDILQKGPSSAIKLARFLVVDKLPEDIEHVLFLEADTFVVSNIDEFAWGGGFNDHLIYGVAARHSVSYMEEIGMPADEPFLNAGVLLMNARKGKDVGLGKKLLDYASDSSLFHPWYFEEVEINRASMGDKGILPLEYNVISEEYYLSYEDLLLFHAPTCCPFYEKWAYEQSLENPKIVHFSGGFFFAKPWYKNCTHPFGAMYKTMMQDLGLSLAGTDNRDVLDRAMSRIYRSTPRSAKRLVRCVYSKMEKRLGRGN